MSASATRVPRTERVVIPAAGLGTRLRPLTTALPKEMLPLGRKPVIEHVIDEAHSSGFREALIIVSPGKEIIRRHLGNGENHGIRIDYAVQPTMRGLGDALLYSEEWVRDEPFAVAFGDCIIASPRGEPPLARLAEAAAAGGWCGAVLAERVPRERVSRYGVLAPSAGASAVSGAFRLADIVEKPSAAEAPSDYVVAARWILGPDIFRWLRALQPSPRGEIELTDAVRDWIRNGDAEIWAVPLAAPERRVDVGGFDSYLPAQAVWAATDEEFGARVREALEASLRGITPQSDIPASD
ncbi:MAG: sugar phosphate nucleotidyltransferase [Chthonomonadales bacterium]